MLLIITLLLLLLLTDVFANAPTKTSFIDLKCLKIVKKELPIQWYILFCIFCFVLLIKWIYKIFKWKM